MKNRRRSVVTHSLAGLVAALAFGCKSNSGGGGGIPDGGIPDGGTPDGGTPDGGTPDGGTPDGGPLGSGAVTTDKVIANGAQFSLPFDAAPSPDGTQVYFTGVDPALGSAIFKVAATGGTPAVIASGVNCPTTPGCIGAPLGIAVSSDGSTIYAADPAFAGSANDNGAIFSIPAAGGNPTALAETADYAPRAIAVQKAGGSDNIYFIGNDKTTGAPGIFKDAAGAVTPVITGNAANDPQALAVYTDGTIYYLDQSGNVQKIAAAGTTATLLGGTSKAIAINFPAGIDVSQDGKFLLVPNGDPVAHGQGIARIDVSNGTLTQLTLTPVLTANQEAGGLHRAANADVYSFVDTGAGATGSGIVYLLK